MKITGWTGIAVTVMLVMVWMSPQQLWAQTTLSNGYTLEDFSLGTAADLVDVCTLEQNHADHVAAMGFCYGFFEGGIHYNRAISTLPSHTRIVCTPEGTTRTQAVEVFVAFLTNNPRYAGDEPIDAIFRALVDKWPCEQ